MSFDEDGIDQELRTDVRARVAGAIEGIADTHEAWQGGIVTGYVLAVEITLDARRQAVTWVTGDGTSPTDDDAGWIPEHRARGILSQVMHDIDSDRVQRS